MNPQERAILQTLDAALNQQSVITKIDPIVRQVESKLAQDREALMAWETVPLAFYGERLPQIIRSSWVFILRARATTGAERHPNSHQRMISYRGTGEMQVWRDEQWQSNLLVSRGDASLENRWATIPPNIWHQAVVPEEDWVVVSFHTVPEQELIEERPDATDPGLTHQRRYQEN